MSAVLYENNPLVWGHHLRGRLVRVSAGLQPKQMSGFPPNSVEGGDVGRERNLAWVC